jgi:hypothetical protein
MSKADEIKGTIESLSEEMPVRLRRKGFLKVRLWLAHKGGD